MAPPQIPAVVTVGIRAMAIRAVVILVVVIPAEAIPVAVILSAVSNAIRCALPTAIAVVLSMMIMVSVTGGRMFVTQVVRRNAIELWSLTNGLRRIIRIDPAA